MADLEERVTYLERRMDTSQGEMRGYVDRGFEQLDGRITALEQKMDTRFAALEQKMDSRFADLEQKMDRRFAAIDSRFTGIDGRFAGVDAHFLALEQKVDHHFTWVVGIQVATLVAMIGTVLGSLYMQRGG